MCGLKKMFQDVSRRNFHQKAGKFFPMVYKMRFSCPYNSEGEEIESLSQIHKEGIMLKKQQDYTGSIHTAQLNAKIHH